MANSIPKIKIGKSVKEREVMDLSRDNSTTAHWGFIQPLMCREMVPNETMNVSVDSFVRLSPMAVPTMARISYNTYHQFVPITTLWEPFESFLAQTDYAAQNGTTYVPTQVPFIQLNDLSKEILNAYTDWTLYKLNGYSNSQITETWSSATIVGSGWSSITNNTLFPTFKIEGNGIPLDVNYKYGNNAITFDGADFVYTFRENDDYYAVCFRLNRAGKNIRQILIGLGYKLNIYSIQRMSILPICAFYKAYFDIFYVQRDFTWKDTNVAKLMMYCQSNNASQLTTNTNEIRFILDDLAKCYYTENPNMVSMAQASVADVKTAIQPTYIRFDGVNDTALGYNGITEQPFIASNQPIDANRLEILDKLTKMVNKNTIIGGRIKDYLTAHYGASFMDAHESNYIGSESSNIQIGDVMATTEAAGQALGDYAGRGTGSNNGKSFKFTSKTFGYYITLATIVPKGGYNQGIDRNLSHLSRYDFYTSEFDALGYQAMRVGEVLANNDAAGYSPLHHLTIDNTFGLVPRYSEYKTCQNVLNGDMSLRSKRDSLIGYTLDKVITDSEVKISNSNNGGAIYHMQPTEFVAGTKWRSVGQYPWMSNYDRVFVNSDVTAGPMYEIEDDNFIVHNIINVKCTSPMLSLSKSFDTWSEDDHNTIEVEKV